MGYVENCLLFSVFLEKLGRVVCDAGGFEFVSVTPTADAG